MAQCIVYAQRSDIAKRYAQKQSQEAQNQNAQNQPVLIYNHIPKCGGLSLSGMLRNVFPYAVDIHQNIFDPRFTPLDRDFYHGHGVSGIQSLLPPDKLYYYITFLRHPWSLAKSLIRFFSWLLPLDRHYKQAPEKLLLAQDANILIQYLGNGDKVLAEENLLQNYAFFGLQENFAASMHLLSEIIPQAASIEHIAKNVSQKKAWDLSPEVKEAFFEKHADDIALYEKAKSEFLRRCAHFETEQQNVAEEIPQNLQVKANPVLPTSHVQGDNVRTVLNLKQSIALDEDLPAMDVASARFENWLFILTHSMQSKEECKVFFQWLVKRISKRLSCLYFAYLVAEKAHLPELPDMAQLLFQLCQERDPKNQCRIVIECQERIVKTCLKRNFFMGHPFRQCLESWQSPLN